MSWKFNPFTKKLDYYETGGGGFGGLYSNLSIKNNTTNPNYQVDVSADTVLLEDSSKAILRIDALSETVDISSSGANGLDTGSEAGSTWYHIWAIAKADGTKDCLLSASATAPTLPAGYTYKAYLGAVYNNGSGDFIAFHQYDNNVSIMETGVLAGGTESSYTSVSLAAAVPSTAKTITGFMSAIGGEASQPGGYIAATSAGLNPVTVQSGGAFGFIFTGTFTMKLVEVQTMYYKNLAPGGSVYTYLSQFSY